MRRQRDESFRRSKFFNYLIAVDEISNSKSFQEYVYFLSLSLCPFYIEVLQSFGQGNGERKLCFNVRSTSKKANDHCSKTERKIYFYVAREREVARRLLLTFQIMTFLATCCHRSSGSRCSMSARNTTFLSERTSGSRRSNAEHSRKQSASMKRAKRRPCSVVSVSWPWPLVGSGEDGCRPAGASSGRESESGVVGALSGRSEIAGLRSRLVPTRMRGT